MLSSSSRQRKTEKDDGTSTPPPGSKKRAPPPFTGRFNPKLGGGKKKQHESRMSIGGLSHQSWSKIVMVSSIALIAYFSSSKPKSTIMARQSETLDPKRYQSFLCPPSFRKEIETINKECAPIKCGRAVIDGEIDAAQVHKMLQVAKKGLSEGGSSGGASILDLHSGALSKGTVFINIHKMKPDLFTASDFESYNTVQSTVKAAIEAHFNVRNLHLTQPTFFSRITSDPAVTDHDHYWHEHIDKDVYPNFHYTSLLYLTDYGIDFQGGEFVFIDNQNNRTIEPKAGRISTFTSGIENRHRVEKVKSGVRYALTMGFTCDPSKAIKDLGMTSS